jgi:hypothetical protein
MNVLASPTLHALRQHIIEQAAALRLPAIYQWGESAREGGLLSYGPFRTDVYQGIARQSRESSRVLVQRSCQWNNRAGSSWSST